MEKKIVVAEHVSPRKKSKFIMLTGIPGSGKTEYAKSLEDVVIFSSDNIRDELYGDRLDRQSSYANAMVFAEMIRRSKAALRRGRNVVFDATNLKRKDRKNILNELKYYDCVKECHVLKPSLSECLVNNFNRDKCIPEKVILKMNAKFQYPMLDEGFDIILKVER